MNFQIFKPMAAIAMFSATLPVFAQDADQSTDPNVFDLGQEVGATDVQPGQQYIRETFGDWGLRCVRVEEGPEPCQLYQLLLNEEDRPLVEVLIVPLPDAGQAVAGATVVVPLETLLTQPLRLSIDGSNAREYAYDFCTAAGCVARFGMTQEQINQFKAGASGTLRLVPAAAPNDEVVLSLSLSGFTAGFDATTVPAQ